MKKNNINLIKKHKKKIIIGVIAFFVLGIITAPSKEERAAEMALKAEREKVRAEQQAKEEKEEKEQQAKEEAEKLKQKKESDKKLKEFSDSVINSSSNTIIEIKPRFNDGDWHAMTVVLSDDWYDFRAHEKERFANEVGALFKQVLIKSGKADENDILNIYFFDQHNAKLAHPKMLGGYKIER